MGKRTRRVLVGTLVTGTLVAAAAGAAYGVLGLSDATGRALQSRSQTPQAVGTVTPTPSPTPSGTPTPSETPTPTPSEEPTPVQPAALLAAGDEGQKVRELQARLAQIAWFGPVASGDYAASTVQAVKGFQGKRGLPRTGEVDARTWKRLLAMTRQPTHAEMFDVPGRTLLGPGDDGTRVRVLQARLRQIAWFFGDVTDHYGTDTETAVKGFQGKRGIPVTGEVDQRTLDLLVGMTRTPTADELANKKPDPAEGAALDPRCTTGRALCIDKSSSSLRWVVDGKVRLSMDVRFGASYSPTREGLFHVEWKDADHVSGLYGSSMPYSMFFSRGQAVHYSSDFAARGYAGASHGCVNVRDLDALKQLFAQVTVGDKVVVYWS